MIKELLNLNQKSKKKVETSKVLLIALYSSAGIIICVAILLAFIKSIVSPLEICATGLFSLSSIATGFYYWKAKAENMHKYKQDDRIEMNHEDK